MIDPMELWAPITKYMVCDDIVEGRYFVSNLGNIYSTFINDYMKLVLCHDGYLIVTLTMKDGRQKNL